MARLVSFAAAAALVLVTAGAAGTGAGGLIVFPATPEGSQVAQLYAVQPSGAGLRQLTTGTHAAVNPAFSHGGKRIAFARFGIGIFTINIDGSRLQRLTTSARDAFPTWSPNGKTIAFVRPVGSAWRLFVVPTTGGKPRMLAASPSPGRPSWTKDGLLIPTAGDLLRVDPGTGRVLKYYAANFDAVWGLNSIAVSPAVTRITYVGTRDPIPGDQDCGDGPCQRYGLFLSNLKGKQRQPRLIVKDAGPAIFSPDGRRIAYVAADALVLRSPDSGATTAVPTPSAIPQPQGPPAWG